MSSALRVGVVGLGYAGRTHIAAYQQVPGVDVVVVADPSEALRRRVHGELGVEAGVASVEELLTYDLDAVSVCVPNHLHEPVATAALEHGCHVLCEKPLATSGVEAARMVQTAEAANRVLHVAFNHRRRGDVAALRAYVEAGGLGSIYHAKASWMRRRGIPGLGSWFTNAAMAGGGPLVDLGVHVLDIALHVLGEPVVLAATAATYAELGPRGRGGRVGGEMQVGSEFEVEDLATAFLRLSGGATLLLEASWAVHGSADDDFSLTVYGTEGGAEIRVHDYGWQDTLRIYTDISGSPAVVTPSVPPGEGHLSVVRDFICTVRSGDWAGHGGREALQRSLVIDACYRSAQLGHEVGVDLALTA